MSTDEPQDFERQLLDAATRLDDEPVRISGRFGLRPEQTAAYRGLCDHIIDAATRPDGGSSFCRVVLPPRTGKTILAAHLIAATNLPATFVVPTLTLVRQVRRAFREILPHLTTGGLDSHEVSIAPHVNVVTYASLVRRHESGTLPAPLGRSLLVFADEAHRAMTPRRMAALRRAFPERAIRIALTATPDYDAVRRLAAYFPDEVHVMELREALRRGLLAPARVWVAEVDADGSHVEIVAGDYEKGTLSRLMATGPFFRAVEHFRHRSPANVGLPCMVACATRQQATDLWRYLQRHRPAGSPEPALLLGETPTPTRDAALADFATGKIDTLIQVGVLIEGWDAPHCKLLIDLAPSRSRVRATQKYFRVLTKHEDAVAHIVVLLPTGLTRPPVLPMDLLLDPGDEYICGRRIGPSTDRLRDRVADPGLTPIRQVRLRARTVICAPLGLPQLDPTDAAAVRRLLVSHPGFDVASPPGRMTFEALYFSDPLFSGTGLGLTRWLGLPRRAGEWERYLARLFPMLAGDWWLGESELAPTDHAAAFDVFASGASADLVAFGLRAAGCPNNPGDPEAGLFAREDVAQLRDVLTVLPPRLCALLNLRFGLDGDDERTFAEIGSLARVSGGRAAQLVEHAVRRLRGEWRVRALTSAERTAQEERIVRGASGSGRWHTPAAFVAELLRAGDAQALRRFLQEEPTHVEAIAKLLAMLPPEADEGLDVLRRAIAAAPPHHHERARRWRLELGDRLMARGACQEAVESWRAVAAALTPAGWEARGRLAVRASREGMYDDALALLDAPSPPFGTMWLLVAIKCAAGRRYGEDLRLARLVLRWWEGSIKAMAPSGELADGLRAWLAAGALGWW